MMIGDERDDESRHGAIDRKGRQATAVTHITDHRSQITDHRSQITDQIDKHQLS
jgi:hypothetical protein